MEFLFSGPSYCDGIAVLQDVSGDPFLGLMGHGDERLQVAETKRGAVAPLSELILERRGKGRRKERVLLTDVLPDRGLDVATAQRVSGFLVGSHLVSSFIEMKLALSEEEESQRTVHGEPPKETAMDDDGV